MKKGYRLREADVENQLPIVPGGFSIHRLPAVGYYLEFYYTIDKTAPPFIQTGLPNSRIQVSDFHHAEYGNAPPGTMIDLRFVLILKDLGLPNLGQHDALSDAVMTAMISSSCVT